MNNFTIVQPGRYIIGNESGYKEATEQYLNEQGVDEDDLDTFYSPPKVYPCFVILTIEDSMGHEFMCSYVTSIAHIQAAIQKHLDS